MAGRRPWEPLWPRAPGPPGAGLHHHQGPPPLLPLPCSPGASAGVLQQDLLRLYEPGGRIRGWRGGSREPRGRGLSGLRGPNTAVLVSGGPGATAGAKPHTVSGNRMDYP